MHRGQRWIENLPLQTCKAFCKVLSQMSHFINGKSSQHLKVPPSKEKLMQGNKRVTHKWLSRGILCVHSLCKSMGRNDRIHYHFWANLFLRGYFLAQIPLFLLIVSSKTHIDVPISNVFAFLITACPNISCQQCQKAAHYNDREED